MNFKEPRLFLSALNKLNYRLISSNTGLFR